ncbi:predicted protein [Histoplasma capsulatum G186AR]|uniref:Uncharacterized protein n=1 Tax=Ajellomyces capsulatus (strain G186AR / H82 / ATCC MYA-2454 / RMSCC 2432) TaxID=447093 RepID=C0NI69_AJECG|nr:uncharacterized protein HCBG_03041 [Histoplasma capsulatum G186AR]EEH09504.1 predicted protein [Histoplasma capsulatum G186AR]
MAPFLDFCYYRRFSSPHGKKIKTVVELAEDERPSDGVSHASPTNFSQTIKTCSGREQERTAISAVRRPWMLAYGFVTVVPMTPSN